MEIELRNGKKIILEWSPIVLEYLEDYEGGIKQLINDLEKEEYRFRTFNFIVYSIVSAVYPEELTYREIVSLVNINDLEKIIDFVLSKFNEMQLTHKNDLINSNQNYKYHRR